MLIVNLIGGLGNQMFQYAFGQSQSLNKHQLVKYDTFELLDHAPKKNFTYRDFELGIFKAEVQIASLKEVSLFKHHSKNLAERISYGGVRWLRQAKTYYEKQNFCYDPDVLKMGNNTYFSGYWQTEIYFRDYESRIRKNFEFRYEPAGLNASLAKLITAQNAVSVHIRRGDYVSDSIANQVHGTCSPAYYEKAVEYIISKVANPTLYIFSDEPEWVRQHMSFAAPATYVAHNHGANSYEDMRLMSLCKHNIIANSSFSWWGAWLNKNPDKCVVAPSRWMTTEQAESSNLIPHNWVRL